MKDKGRIVDAKTSRRNKYEDRLEECMSFEVVRLG